MEKQDFNTTITVSQTPMEAFNAINNVRGWWSENITGDTDKLNSIFDYHYQDIHRCTIKIIEFMPAKKVVWLVTDNYFKFTEDKTEWIGTKIIFDITEIAGGTEVRFTHHGLTPKDECYQICFDAWTHFIQDSLRSLIAASSGNPSSPQDEDNFNERNVKKWKLDE